MTDNITTPAIIGAETPEAAAQRLRAERTQLQAEIATLRAEQVQSWDDPRLKTLAEQLYETAQDHGVTREYEVMAKAVGLPRPTRPYTVVLHSEVMIEVPVDAMSVEDARGTVLDDIRASSLRDYFAQQLGATTLPDALRITNVIAPEHEVRER